MNPLWMVKTRFQIIADPSVGQKTFQSYGDVARVIWKEEGPQGFMKGLTASYVGCFEGAIQWIVYEKLKSVLSNLPPRALSANTAAAAGGKTGLAAAPAPTSAASESSTRVGGRTPTPAEYFIAAAAAKCAAVLATYPHEVVRTRLREQATSGVFKYRGFTGALLTIAKEEGARWVHQLASVLIFIYMSRVLTHSPSYATC